MTTLCQLCIIDIMASSSISLGEVCTLFSDNLDLFDEDINDNDYENYIYGYLGGRILCRPELIFQVK